MARTISTVTKRKTRKRATPKKARHPKGQMRTDEAAVIHQNIYAAAPYDETKIAATE